MVVCWEPSWLQRRASLRSSAVSAQAAADDPRGHSARASLRAPATSPLLDVWSTLRSGLASYQRQWMCLRPQAVSQCMPRQQFRGPAEIWAETGKKVVQAAPRAKLSSELLTYSCRQARLLILRLRSVRGRCCPGWGLTEAGQGPAHLPMYRSYCVYTSQRPARAGKGPGHPPPLTVGRTTSKAHCRHCYNADNKYKVAKVGCRLLSTRAVTRSSPSHSRLQVGLVRRPSVSCLRRYCCAHIARYAGSLLCYIAQQAACLP